MSLKDLYDATLGWLFDACFGRVEASDDDIGRGISLLGTIKQMLRREAEED